MAQTITIWEGNSTLQNLHTVLSLRNQTDSWTFPIPYFLWVCETTVVFFVWYLCLKRLEFCWFSFPLPGRSCISVIQSTHTSLAPVVAGVVSFSVYLPTVQAVSFLMCFSSFLSAYSGCKCVIVKDALIVFLKKLLRRMNWNSGKAFNLELVMLFVMVTLRWELQASWLWRCPFSMK